MRQINNVVRTRNILMPLLKGINFLLMFVILLKNLYKLFLILEEIASFIC